MENINKPEITQIIEKVVELKGNKGLCPFHLERTASFFVNPKRQTFRCYGCGEHGDVITFIQKFYGLSFKDACKYLNLNKPTGINSETQTRKNLVKEFHQWETAFKAELTDFYRDFKAITRDLQTMEDVEEFAEDFHLISIAEYYLDILTNGTDEEKYNLYKRTR